MSEQARIETAVEMTIDNCEVLRERLAKYEDADGNPITTIAEQAREIERLNSDYNEACEDAMCVARELERQKMNCLNLLQQLEDLKAQPSGVVLPDPKKEIVAWGHDMGGNYDEGHADGWNDALDEVARLNSSPVRAGVVDERAAFEAWYETTYGISLEPEFRANHFIGYVNDKANHRWTAWQARATLSATSHGEQVREGSLSRESLTLAYRLITKELETLANGSAIDRFKSAQGEFRSAIAAAPSAGSHKEQK